MNWYVAISSLVTGFALGALIMKRADTGPVEKIDTTLSEVLRAFIKMQTEYGKHFQRIFDINRQILVALIGRKPDLSVLRDESPEEG